MKKESSLTGKIYVIEFLSGMIFYVIGILLITPISNPPILKTIVLGATITVQALIIIYTAFVRAERIDERAEFNFNKASSITLYTAIILVIILGITIEIFSFNPTFSSGLIALVLATTLCLHALLFHSLEQDYS